jgi:hypothetical protein
MGEEPISAHKGDEKQTRRQIFFSEFGFGERQGDDFWILSLQSS